MSKAPAKSIQKKLVASSLAVQAGTMLCFLAIVIWINVSLAARQKKNTVASIGNSLITKGRILVSNNAQALREMVPENGFTAVANLVSSTVRDDEDVVYGIFMDASRRPWVRADSVNPDGAVSNPVPLDDSTSLWASQAAGLSYRRMRTVAGPEVIEFAAPVVFEGDTLGVLRYGLTTAGMEAAIASASRSAHQALARTIAALALFGSLALFFFGRVARRQAVRITRPIEELQVAANAIAGGDYATPVSVSSDDEVGLLASDFDSMRRTVKEYTERLQDMVKEKIREIKDILDNIEQGLFTVEMDGKVNPDYALSTNAILSVEDAARCALGELFRLGPVLNQDWMEWLELVREKHGSMRWEKLVRLCPVRELLLLDPVAGERVILVGYQKMFDSRGRLTKLMILVQDVTEARRIERMIKEEQERHEHEVKAILGIVRYSSFIPEFLADTESRLRNLGVVLRRPPSAQDPARSEALAGIARDLHTMKGTAATYGFEALSLRAREAETALEELCRPGIPLRTDEWAVLAPHCERIESSLQEIRGFVGHLSGGEGVSTVPVSGQRIRDLRALSSEARNGGAPETLQRLLQACQSIDYVRLEKLADKYRSLLDRIGERLGKRFEFLAVPAELEVSPALFADLDEPLAHLIRNAADHGIEMEAIRLLHGKPGPGIIRLILEVSESGVEVTVADDGNGIDGERLAEKALAMGLIDAETLASLDDQGRKELVFLPGLSSRDQTTEISGMGVGMDAVAEWARSRGGKVALVSQMGQGTRVILSLPGQSADTL